MNNLTRFANASWCNRRTYGILLLWFVVLVGSSGRFAADALMIARHRSVHHPPPTLDAQDVSRSISSTIRIRSMREDDLPAVSELLASEIVQGQQKSADAKSRGDDNNMLKAALSWNHCKAHLDRMRQKSLVETELRHRLQAIQEGRKVWSKFQTQLQQQPNGVSLPQQSQQQQQHILRWIWSHDSFRTRVQCAAQLHRQNIDSESNQNPHHHPLCWEEHDINVTPADAKWLQHVMMIAEEVVVKRNGNGNYQGSTSNSASTCSSTVVGFCEVGRMSTPLYYVAQQQQRQEQQQDNDSSNINDVNGRNADQEGQQDLFSAPTILNMVISPYARRRGIATSLVSTAQYYVRRQWNERHLCLYVDTNNHEALSLYQRLGFEPSRVQPPQQQQQGVTEERLEPDAKHVVLWQKSPNGDASKIAETTPRHFRHLRRQLC